MPLKPRIIAIVGPTASGKSDLAVMLARRFDGEVISADSRQVYRGMNIGTGKVTIREMGGIPHHLLDVVSPKKFYTVTDYQRDATRAVQEVLGRGKLPIVCGGTGFYVSALVDGLLLPDVPPNIALRKRLEKKTPLELFGLLKKIDPMRAKTVEAKNPRRLIRAIEIATTLGSVPALKRESPYDLLIIGISIAQKKLRERIHIRLLKRMKTGMEAEVRCLHRQGVSWKRMGALGLEYKYLALYLQKKMTKKVMLSELEKEIGRYAKRQMTWFNKDKRIHWVAPANASKTSALARKFLKKTSA